MPGLDEEAKNLRARVVELEKSLKAKSSKGRAKQKTTEMEIVAEQPRTERV